MRDATPVLESLQSWFEQGRPPAQQPGPGLVSWGPPSPGFHLPQPEGLHGQNHIRERAEACPPSHTPMPLQDLEGWSPWGSTIDRKLLCDCRIVQAGRSAEGRK